MIYPAHTSANPSPILPINAVRKFAGITPTIAASVMVDSQSSIIGDVHIGEDSSVWPQAVIRGDVNYIRIGQRTSIQDGCVLHVTHAGPYCPDGMPLHVGDEVTVGHNVVLHACRIGNQVMVGMGATVLDGAVVEDQVIIGANSLVPANKTLASGYLYLGSPVQQKRKLTQAELDMLPYLANNYVKLKNIYMEETQ